MRLVLKQFQEEAVTRLVRHIRGAARDSRSGDLQSVCLSSTTGSGKTVMLTRAVELLLQGDDENAPLADATFLWITDQPELNEQTRKKMLATSSVLNTENLLVIDASFDQETISAGTVNFINIHKLGREKSLVTQGDRRTYTIWEIIRNTISSRPGQFFVVVDEAHRGMTEEKGQAEAATIIQKFIKGSPGELPPVPVVVGISATPERFNQLIVGTGRMNRPIDVDVADVRASGLIKDTIVLHHPTKEQPSDMTMLREAARSLKKYTTHWASYCASEEQFTVLPLLVVQVEDSGGKGELSETDIAAAIGILRDETGTLPSEAFAHAFQEGVPLTIGGADVRYLAPSEIEHDPDVRVVFFKTSLNTGWDCPRAEVMMSFRAAADSTYIAQLVGRMVRTPLARRVVDDEVLNTVALYLPHYDGRALDTIIAKLSKPDIGMPPVEVEKSEDVVELHRAPGTEKVFACLTALPSYVVPRKRKSNQVRRLMKLARLLTNDDINTNALSTAKQALLTVLANEYDAKKATTRFKEIVDERQQIEIEAVNWDVGADATREGELIKVDILQRRTSTTCSRRRAASSMKACIRRGGAVA
jgi:type III restriction enzyme